MFCLEPYSEVTEANKVQEHLAKHADITISSGINSVDSLFPFWAGRDGTWDGCYAWKE
jgi:hypothetical protein